MNTSSKKSIKQKVCAKCALHKTCGEVPGLCMFLPFSVLGSVIVMLTYFMLTMDL